MFRSIQQLNLDNNNQCPFNHNDDDEVTDKDITRGAAVLSSINGVSKTSAFDTLCIWMVLYVGLNRHVQQRDF